MRRVLCSLVASAGMVVAVLTAAAVPVAGVATMPVRADRMQAVAAASAAPSPLSTGRQVDVYTPVNLGWDSSRGGYHFRVYFTWKLLCSSVFCNIKDGTTAPYKTAQNMSDPDIVSLAFDKRMQVRSVKLETWAVCGHSPRSSTRLVGSDSGMDSASSEVQDTVFPDSACGSGLERVSYCAAGGGGGGCASWSENATMTYGYYHVWANPVSGCNTSMRARGYYAHSWSRTGISVGASVPWGVSVSPTSGSAYWQVSNRTDWDQDEDYIGTVCRR